MEQWQLDILKGIEKIKIERIKPQDLLQEMGASSDGTIKLLPMGEAEHQKNYLKSTLIQKSITTALSGFAISFGIVLGNWRLGVIYGLMILLSYISAIIVGTDFSLTTLRNRFIAKASLLNEFFNLKDKFINPEPKREGEQDGTC